MVHHSCFLCGKINSDEKLSLFHFPKRKEERERWISICRPYVNLNLLKVTHNTRICQRHFSPNSFHCKRERVRLRYKAAPSIFFEKRLSYRRSVPLFECDDEELHQNHFLANGIPNGVDHDEDEGEGTHSKYYGVQSPSDFFDFENPLDCVTVDTADILSVPASEFVEVQMDADQGQLINENDTETTSTSPGEFYSHLTNGDENVRTSPGVRHSRSTNGGDIENISIPQGEPHCRLTNGNDIENIYIPFECEVDIDTDADDCMMDEPPPSPNCIVISSDESSDESSATESSDTISVHDDHTYCEPPPASRKSLAENSTIDKRKPSGILPNLAVDSGPAENSTIDNRRPSGVLPNLVSSAHLDVMRVSVAHYKNSTRTLQDRLRKVTKILENVEHAIHELGLSNKISKSDMEKLLNIVNPN